MKGEKAFKTGISSRKVKFLSATISLFLIWIFLAPLLADNLIIAKPLGHADAILILGGSSTFQERTQKAAELYQKGIAPRIFLTDDGGQAGWSRREQKNPKFVELAQKSLIEKGVRAEDIEILQPAPVEGTIDEARVLAEKAKTENLKAVLLVTSAYHTRRALKTFEKVLAAENLEIGVESPPTGIQTPSPGFWWLRISGWTFIGGEYVKSVYYWAFY